MVARASTAPTPTPQGPRAASLAQSIQMSYRFASVLMFLLLLAGPTLNAQSRRVASAGTISQGSIHGAVKDNTGGIIPGAVVTLTSDGADKRTETAKDDGTFTFAGLDPGTYMLTADYSGLQPLHTLVVKVKAGASTPADVIMVVRETKQELTVTESTNQISTEAAANASALVLNQQDLDALPDDPDDLEADLEALAGPSSGPGGVQIFVDGFTGGRLPPKSSIREVRINSNPLSAEYDKLGFGRVEIFTKPGTDKFHGQGYFGTSDGIWNSRNPFLPTAPPFKTDLFGGNLSGPLTKKASFFIDFDNRIIDDNGIVNATVPTANFLGSQVLNSYYATPQRRTTVSPRVDYQLSANNTLSMRYSYLDNRQTLTGVGGFDLSTLTVGNVTLPSNGYSQDTNEHLFQLVDTAVLSPRVINETHFQYARDQVNQSSVSTSPQINVANSFTAGGSGYSAAGYPQSYDIQNQYELQNYTSMTLGAHVVKFGIRVRSDLLEDYSARNFNGTFSFLGTSTMSSIQQYLMTVQLLNAGYSSQQVTAMGYGPSQYSVSSGTPKISFWQSDFGPFVQDDWRLKSNLMVSLGLRWESQTNINDHNDWAPRVALAWSPDSGSGGKSKTVIRAGWGIFYDRFPAADVLNALRYNGSNQINYIVENPTVYNSAFTLTPDLSQLTAQNTAQRYEIDSNLHAPRLMQTVVSVERQLARSTTLNVNYIDARGVHELLTDDINAPLPGTYLYSVTGTNSDSTGIRPYGNVGNIYDYQSTGTFKQTQLSVGVNSSLGKWMTLFSRYAYGDAHSDTDGLTTMPANPYNIAEDWGRSSLDIKHFVLVGGSISGPWGLRLSPFFIAHSGTPFNITTGTDIYGTGQAAASARPSIVSGPGEDIVYTPFGYLDTIPTTGQNIIERNAGIGPGFIELNLRLSKTWGFGTTKFEGPSGGSTSRQGGGPPGGGPPPGGGRGPGGGGPGGGGPPPGGMFNESSQHRYNLTLSIMARNALNHENLSAPIGVVTSPYFLESTTIAGGFGPQTVASNQRRIDLQLRFAF